MMQSKDKWSMAYHRIKAAQENAKDGKPGPCNCKECREYMESLGLETNGRERMTEEAHVNTNNGL